MRKNLLLIVVVFLAGVAVSAIPANLVYHAYAQRESHDPAKLRQPVDMEQLTEVEKLKFELAKKNVQSANLRYTLVARDLQEARKEALQSSANLDSVVTEIGQAHKWPNLDLDRDTGELYFHLLASKPVATPTPSEPEPQPKQ